MSARVLPRDGSSAWRERARAWWEARADVGTESLILAASAYFTLFANAPFWRAAAPHPASQPGWALSLLLMVTAAHALLLGLLVWRPWARPLLSLLVLVAAFAGHFMGAYGIYLDADMVRNVLHTDWQETRDLLSPDLLKPLLLSLPPLAVLWRLRPRARPLRRALLARAALLSLAGLAFVAGALLSSQQLSSFVRNQREVRYLVTPANVLVSLSKVLSEEPTGRPRALAPVGLDARQRAGASTRRPRLLVLVVGETARAANWGLNGYARQTTPELAKLDVINFPDVTACGSSTEVSLPCMFSSRGREHYDASAIRGEQSLLHVLDHAGIGTLWRDNQSGCKGVCQGLPTQAMREQPVPGACTGQRCLDEILLSGLEDELDGRHGDQVVVLHMLGNHGPNYFERYPPAFRRFQPVCATAELGKCERAQIVNAYDNALLYTDHVLAQAIALLERQARFDAALLYVSDHGESLGEKGLYLHGMPYAIAPQEQLRVPMVAWFSPQWARSTLLDLGCVRQRASLAYRHDHLFHSVLGLAEVETALYRPERDAFASCRAKARAADPQA